MSQVLCFHLVGAGVGGPIDLDLATFDTYLQTLRSTKRVCSLLDVAMGADGIALTFDDAFENFHDIIWTRLRAADLPATLFVPTGFIDGTHGSPLSTAPQLRPCSWTQLRSMRAQGLDIGSHTRRHQNLRRLDNEEIDADLAAAAQRLKDELSVDDTALCYPQAKWSPRVEHVARRHHKVIVTGGGLPVDVRRPWRVPRTSIVMGGPSLERILRWPIEPREWLADKVRQWRR